MSIEIREIKPGEASLAAHFYYKIFEQQFDFLPSTEQYFLQIVTEYFDDMENNRIWVAVENDVIKGTVAVDNHGEHDAQLRLFGTDQSLQGTGMGKKLLHTALDYCDQKGFTHISLWTIDICKAAVHLYEKFGFRMTDTKPNDIWANYHMTEELWEKG